MKIIKRSWTPKICTAIGGLLYALIQAQLCHAQQAGSPLELIRSSLGRYLPLVSSLEFKCKVSGDGMSKVDVHYVEDGARYRISKRYASQPAGTSRLGPEYDAAFDGQRYSTIEHGESVLTTASVAGGYINTMRVGVELPHLELFIWLSDARRDGEEPRWGMLSSPGTWDRRFADATYVGASDGHHVVRFPQLRPAPNKWLYEVHFQADGFMLPTLVKRIRLSDDVVVWSVEVGDFGSANRDTRAVPFPVSLTTKVASRTRRIEVDPASLRVNHKVDPAIFTLPRDAKTIIDVDALQARVAEVHRLEKVAGVNDAELQAGYQGRIPFIVANGIAVAALVIYIWYKGRHASA